jgi:hypothetical protein
MSALLMAAMSKLAAMRTTAPVVSQQAGDTVTKLMRGLFGNLLTIAGSGVRPQSMVWQLFGLNSQPDLPKTDIEWIWYETVVALYPYTGWPLEHFYEILEKLLDKALIRVVTKNEKVDGVRSSRTDEMIRFCKLRNVQLDHSRSIITIFMRMLTAESEIAPVATRLLEQIPEKLERQSKSYTRMIEYLKHLANGGERRANDDLVAASVYTSRSAAFGALKREASDACKSKDWVRMKDSCQAIMDKHTELASLWHIQHPGILKIQNIKLYKELLDADFGDDIDEATKTKNLALSKKIHDDAEKQRIPWQVGNKGQFGDDIEPLDEVFLHEVLTGEKSESLPVVDSAQELSTETTAVIEAKAGDFEQFESIVKSNFIIMMEKDLSTEIVCSMLNVPVSTMRVFIKALNPTFVWEDLGKNFKITVLGLLKERSHREESHPTKKLLDLVRGNAKLQIDG